MDEFVLVPERLPAPPTPPNIYTDEGTVNGTVTITFPWRSRNTTVVNDSTTGDLTVTISGYSMTLKPAETHTMTIMISSIILTSSVEISYRVWGFC